MLIQNIDVEVQFLTVQRFIKGCVLALVFPLITRFHNRVSRERLCIPLCGNFPLFRNSVIILFIYSERLGVFNQIVKL